MTGRIWVIPHFAALFTPLAVTSEVSIVFPLMMAQPVLGTRAQILGAI